MNSRIWLSGIVAAGLGIMVLVAAAQPPSGTLPAAATEPRATVVRGEEGTLVQLPDGRVVRTFVETVPDGGKVLRTVAPGPNTAQWQPYTTADGKTYYAVTHPTAADPELQQMMAAEQSAAQEARTLAAQFAQADSESAKAEAKTKLREKLAAIFDLQQKRRAREIAKIEERLGKLKDTMKKRDDSKAPIIERRLDQLTGGIDELGWEETGGISGYPATSASPYGYGEPSVVPAPRYAPGKPLPVAPPPTVPGATPTPVPPPAR